MKRVFLSFFTASSLIFASASIYDQCQATKGCLGSSSNCLQAKDCPIVTTYQKVSKDEVQFEIGSRASTAGYSALAISAEPLKDNATVIACVVTTNKTVDVQMYLNIGDDIKPANHHGVLSNMTGFFDAAGFAQCRFAMKAVSIIAAFEDTATLSTNLKEPFYLHLMSGFLNAQDQMGPFFAVQTSAAAIDLNFQDGGAAADSANYDGQAGRLSVSYIRDGNF